MTQDFTGFGLPPKLLQALNRVGFTQPTPIQEQAIPLALKGCDILGSAQTGTGKTGAFGIPLVAKLMDDPHSAALILTPTRELAAQVEPLEEVIDKLKEQMRTRHILRMQRGACSIEAGFVWSDLLTDLERISDHCSNIAGCVLDAAQHNLNLHETLRTVRREDADFRTRLAADAEKYRLPDPEE